MVFYNDDDFIPLLKKRVLTSNAKHVDNYVPLDSQLPTLLYYVQIVNVSAFTQANKVNDNI